MSIAVASIAASVSLVASAQTPPAPKPAMSAVEVNLTHRDERGAFDGSPDHFTGRVRVEPLLAAHGPDRASGGSVTFQPGAHTAWHTHPLGQTLIVTAGVGRVQYWGGAMREMRPGDVVWIPAGVKHWHGAAPTTSMTHIAIAEQADGEVVAWMEKVSAAQYAGGVANAASAAGVAKHGVAMP